MARPVPGSVLHVLESTAGGLGVFLEGLAGHQLRTGRTVTIAAPSGGPVLERLVAAGAHHAPWEATAQPGPAVPAELRRLGAVAGEARPQLVHLHSSKAGLCGRLLVRGRLPTVHQPHAWSFVARTGAVARATLAWERLAARWAHVVLCVSEDERRLGEQAGVRADFRVLVNGVDLERWTPPRPGDRAAARAALGLGDGPLVVLSGRLHRQKGQAVLLDAWPRVRARVPGARAVLVGDGPDRAGLEARGVEGVAFAGAQADVRPWLLAADVVAAPSRWEGMSLSLLEAMACARSVVVTGVPGMREVVVEGTGAVVAAEDPAALAAALAERLADPARAGAEGAAGRRRIEARHDRRAQHAAIDALYAELTR